MEYRYVTERLDLSSEPWRTEDDGEPCAEGNSFQLFLNEEQTMAVWCIFVSLDSGKLECKLEVPCFIEWDSLGLNGLYELARGHGCDTGTYMPAVRYADAKRTMSEHGDDILECIDAFTIQGRKSALSWGTLAARLVSMAVEEWARNEVEQ